MIWCLKRLKKIRVGIIDSEVKVSIFVVLIEYWEVKDCMLSGSVNEVVLLSMNRGRR